MHDNRSVIAKQADNAWLPACPALTLAEKSTPKSFSITFKKKIDYHFKGLLLTIISFIYIFKPSKSINVARFLKMVYLYVFEL